MKYYSQLTQDKWILETFNESGFFVECGASNGIDLSNTLALEQAGWDGICIECSSEYQQLVKNRKCKTDNRALWKTTGDELDFNEKNIIQYSSLVAVVGDKNCKKHYKVITVTLHDLLREHNAPHTIEYFSLDTEGSELTILEAFDFSFIFKCITVEHNYKSHNRDGIRKILTKNGYKLYKEVKWDDWYKYENIM